MPLPDMTPVDSSNIEAIGYDVAGRELHVRFLSGPTYVYSDVPPETHQELMQAASHGSYLNREIKANYPYRQES